MDVLDRLARAPRLWNGLRWVAEAGFRGERRLIARQLGPQLGPGARVLDLGCGTGEFAAALAPAMYVGVDVNLGYVTWAGAHRPARFAAMNGRALGFPAATFDAAMVVGVLHHLDDDVAGAMVGELRRVLRPGATALVLEDVPARSPLNLPGRALHWLDRGDHIRAGEDAYRRLLEPAFHVVATAPLRSGICDYATFTLLARP